jgi:exopolyphosphatase / guanosine-5'-triphosphate,3'-diphosphate pyrophosphatase
LSRVAVVDLGTNSTRLLVAEVEAGRVVELDRRLTITRLGEGVDAQRALLPAAVERVASALEDYRRAATALGVERRLAFATSAVRDATNGRSFLREMQERFGFPTRLLTGDEEALLTFQGVCASRDLGGRILVVDLGGGSTELIAGDGAGVSFHASLEIGCVRLTERFLRHDPPTRIEIDRLRSFVATLLAARVPVAVRPESGIGVAGTVTTLATLDLGLADEDPALVHGHRLARDWIATEAELLAATPVAALRTRRGVLPGRAPVIAAGALALAAIADHFGLDWLDVSEADILHGAVLELASPLGPQERISPSSRSGTSSRSDRRTRS